MALHLRSYTLSKYLICVSPFKVHRKESIHWTKVIWSCFFKQFRGKYLYIRSWQIAIIMHQNPQIVTIAFGFNAGFWIIICCID